jgi:hypothetical protein
MLGSSVERLERHSLQIATAFLDAVRWRSLGEPVLNSGIAAAGVPITQMLGLDHRKWHRGPTGQRAPEQHSPIGDSNRPSDDGQ